jgi:hypothetical protein
MNHRPDNVVARRTVVDWLVCYIATFISLAFWARFFKILPALEGCDASERFPGSFRGWFVPVFACGLVGGLARGIYLWGLTWMGVTRGVSSLFPGILLGATFVWIINVLLSFGKRFRSQ